MSKCRCNNETDCDRADVERGTVVSHGSGVNILERTITSAWRNEIAGPPDEHKRHWRTKVRYYDAVLQLLHEGDTPDALTWRVIVDTVLPRGNRSTFYEVAGPNAKHGLVGALLRRQSVEAMQLVLCYRRSLAVDQLIDEAKVYSYWPHREVLLAHLRANPCLDGTVLSGQLITSVVNWARQAPEVASALSFAPPLCAVEDLLLVRCGQISANRALALLSDTMKSALDPEPPPVGSLSGAGRPAPDSAVLLAGLAEQIDAIERETQRFTTAEAAQLRRRAADLMLGAALALI